MKKSFHRLWAWLALLCLLAAWLAGCAKAPAGVEPTPGVSYAQMLSAMDRQLDTPLAADMNRAGWWRAVGGRIMAYGQYYDPADPENPEKRRDVLVDLQADGVGYSCIDLTLPEPTDTIPGFREALAAQSGAAGDLAAGYDYAYGSLRGAAQDNDGVLHLLWEECIIHYSQDAQGNVLTDQLQYALILCTLAADGTVQPAAVLSVPEKAACTGDMLFDEAGSLWISAVDSNRQTQGWLLRYAADGSLQKTLALPEGATFLFDGTLCLLPENRLAVIGNTARADGIVYADSARPYIAADITGDPVWQEVPPFPDAVAKNVYRFVPALESVGRTIGLQTEKGIYCWGWQDNSLQPADGPQLSWKEFGIDPYMFPPCFDVGGGQTLVVCRADHDLATPYQLRILTPLDPAVVAGRTVLTLAGDGQLAGMQDAVNRFNAASDTCYVQTVDYSYPAAQAQGFDSGRDMLRRDILNHNTPDILFASLLDESTLSKGVLIDLYPYLDADSELAREDFLPGVFSSTARGGQLPSVLANFGFYTLVGPSALVGDAPGWSWAEYDALCAAHPNAVPVFNTGRLQLLLFMVQSGGSKYLDSAAGQAHFDTPDFAHLLEATAACPEQPDYTQLDPKPAIEAGQVLLEFQPYAYWRRIQNQHYVYGDDFTFIGFPNDEGKTGAFITPGIQLGISSDCKDPAAAWQLVRSFLLPEFQEKVADESSMLYFPVRLDALQQAAAQAMQPGTQHWRSGYTLPDLNNSEDDVLPSAYFRQALSQQDADKIWEILNSLDTLGTSDETVNTILAEESAAFYAGQRSAEETAKIIQNRVQTYLDEQG